MGSRNNGFYIINLEKTLEKLELAARVIVAVENPKDIMVHTMKGHIQRAVRKFAYYTGTKTLSGSVKSLGTENSPQFTPGTLTNQIQKRFEEPRLLLVADPATDQQPITE